MKLAREACKQSHREWLPILGGRRTPAELVEERAGAVLAVLQPREGMSMDTWLRSLRTSLGGIGTNLRPIVLMIGPEGGFTADETDALLAAGATHVTLAPHVLRIETAALAAMAVAAAVLQRLQSPAHRDALSSGERLQSCPGRPTR